MKTYFIHGLAGSKNNFKYLQEYFPNSESFDLPGFGREEKPDVVYDKEFFINFLEKKIRDKCILVGHSMGSMVAKDFALKHPDLVEKLYLISYPLQKSPKALSKIYNHNSFISMFMKDGLWSRFLCNSKHYYKYIIFPFAFIFKHKYYDSIKDYFLHTHHSLMSSMDDMIMKDDYKELFKVKDKAVLIYGENDLYVDKSLMKEFNSYEIKGMGHYFFGYEEKIKKIIE
jgi:3-oxoadipate enol-lactonase